MKIRTGVHNFLNKGSMTLGRWR